MADTPDKLTALLGRTDLLKVRDTLLEAHRQAREEASSRGEECWFKTEYAAAWPAFRDNPTIETARQFFTAVPELQHFLEEFPTNRRFALLETTADGFVDAVVEASKFLAKIVEQEVGQTGGAAMVSSTGIFWNCTTFVLHVMDRVVFSRLSFSDRDLFMNQLPETLEKRIEHAELQPMRQFRGDGFIWFRHGNDLKFDYNRAQMKWSQFQLVPAKDKSLQGTLNWEFAKDVSNAYSQKSW